MIAMMRILAEAEDDVAGAQAADTGATTPVAAHGSPTETSIWLFINILPLLLLDGRDFLKSGSGNEAVAEEERIHQSVAVESAIRGQPELVSAARPEIPRTSVLADMDAFFREFDRTSFSSRHAEHFWTFDDRKADFEIFRVPQGGIRFLKALWERRLSDSDFILDYLRRLAHGMFSRRVLAELREAEARVAALRDALNIVAPNPWDLASARRASAESDDGSALHDLLA
uniref:Uncharacterized protein n=1 Tax=Fagus sylvatica TaxID=28930 RepID=A0A2N9EIY9_FAGSY